MILFQIPGQAGDDVIASLVGDDVIASLAGDDVIASLAGDDVIASLVGGGGDVIAGLTGNLLLLCEYCCRSRSCDDCIACVCAHTFCICLTVLGKHDILSLRNIYSYRLL